MRKFSLQINGAAVEAETEPRTHLADFLRGERFLTGTHIGCEHGVCGACTVLIDGAPARSCITYAVACEGADITTIEGLRDDVVTAELRQAFSAHHGLQCGYCTPGMLMSCRDIVTRLPDADEARIRLELSGNLCRCTGYVGIVSAVKQVLDQRKSSGAPAIALRGELGPVGAHAPAIREQSRQESRHSERPVRATAAPDRSAPSSPQNAVSAQQWRAVETDGVELLETFGVAFSRAQVWDFFDDLDRVARCIPGARLTKPPRDGVAEGEVSVKLGPIVSAFAGMVEVERDAGRFSGTVRGAGRDAKSGSNARAIISYQVNALAEATTQVDISVKFLLTGALAQFGRSGLVKDVADHLTQLFTANLEAALSGKPVSDSAGATLNAASLARAALWNRIRAVFGKWWSK
jgi:carbon-monoxide dehydrogenase small subunit